MLRDFVDLKVVLVNAFCGYSETNKIYPKVRTKNCARWKNVNNVWRRKSNVLATTVHVDVLHGNDANNSSRQRFDFWNRKLKNSISEKTSRK